MDHIPRASESTKIVLERAGTLSSGFGERMQSAKVVDFYDKYVARQLSGAYNKRHLILIDRVRALGLKADSSVREIGCGIGVMTSLLSEVVTRGRIVATDISSHSVEAARVLNADASNRVVFRTERADEFVPEPEAYDFVCMFDVLEHIPLAEHEAIFSGARKSLRESGLLVVSIPNAAYNRYLREHDPEALQPVDHELEVVSLVDLARRAGLALRRFEEFDAWEAHQYHLFAFRPIKEYSAAPVQVPDPPTPFLSRVQRRLRIRRTHRTFS